LKFVEYEIFDDTTFNNLIQYQHKRYFLIFLLSTLGIIQWMYRVTHKWMRYQRRLYGFHVYSLNPRQDYIKDITVILPGYICCIKRVGLTLHWVAQTGKYDWMHIVCTVHVVQFRIILCVQYMLYSLESYNFQSGAEIKDQVKLQI